MLCVVIPNTLNSVTPKLFGVVFPKYYKMTSTDLGNQCSKTCLWIPLTMVKSLLLNSALLEIRNPALLFNCSYASSVLNKIRNPLTVWAIRLPLQILPTFRGIHLQLWNPKQLAIFACCGIRDRTNVQTKFKLHSYVRRIRGSIVSGTHLHFGLCFKISIRNIQTQNCAPVQCTVGPRNALGWNSAAATRLASTTAQPDTTSSTAKTTVIMPFWRQFEINPSSSHFNPTKLPIGIIFSG